MTAGPLRILLVDDDEGIREALGDVLRDEGFSVETASNGLEAMQWLAANRPPSCVLLLDLMMPVMDGREFLRRKQADPDTASYPVVIITASMATSAGHAHLLSTPDVRACLAKPIEIPQLMAALESCAP